MRTQELDHTFQVTYRFLANQKDNLSFIKVHFPSQDLVCQFTITIVKKNYYYKSLIKRDHLESHKTLDRKKRICMATLASYDDVLIRFS